MNQLHPKSQTTQIPYQDKTQEKLNPKSDLFWNICSMLLIAIIFGAMALTMLRSCADDQHRIGEKYRAQNIGTQLK